MTTDLSPSGIQRLLEVVHDRLLVEVLHELLVSRSRAAALEEAMKPFARAAEFMTSDYEHDQDPVTKADRVVIEVGDLRKARAVLSGVKPS